VTVDGRTFRLDAVDSLRLSVTGSYEPEVTALLQRELRPGDLFIDVGAHVGFFTVLMAERVAPGGLVLAFEPDPSNAELLRTNVARNACTNVQIHQAAVSDRDGEALLYRSPTNPSDHRLDPRASELREAVPARCVRLETAVHGLPHPRLVKIDVQGHEPRVLDGMERILQGQDELRLVLEFWPQGLEDAGSSAEALLDRLLDHGFRLHRIGADGPHAVQRADLLGHFSARRGNFTNLFCLRPGTKLR